MAKAEASVDELVGMIERGELRLPEMQRRYVWRSTRVRDLMDSLYRGYPSGAILIWETDEDVPLQEFSVKQKKSPYGNVRLLLDGQQRLTSLSAVIRGQPVTVRGRKRPIDLLFNLDHPDKLELVTEVDEESDDDESEIDAADSSQDELQQRFQKMTFVVATNKLSRLPNWVKVSEVFNYDGDAEILEKAGVTSLKDPRYKKYSERLAKLRGTRKYIYRMDVLERTLSYEEVTEIFVRVNSLGAKLRSSDLALAQITAKWRNSLAIFQSYQTQCAKKEFDIELGLLLKNLITFATSQSRFKAVNRLGIDQLQDAWNRSMEGMDFAINFVRSNIGITSPVLLSSPVLLITVAFYGASRNYHLSNQEEKMLAYWVRITNAKGRYSRGSSESLHDQDLATIRDGGGVEDLLLRLKNQVGSLAITHDELVGRNRRSAVFKTMFLAFKADGAKDWLSNLSIAIDHAGAAHRLQFHHIFPKAYLRKLEFTAREADDIANLSFIGGKTNRRISDKAPAIYLPEYIEKSGKAAFAKQCIPLEKEMLDGINYKKFVAYRREKIAERLNKYLETGD